MSPAVGQLQGGKGEFPVLCVIIDIKTIILTEGERGLTDLLHHISHLHASSWIQKPLRNGGNVTSVPTHWNQECGMWNVE